MGEILKKLNKARRRPIVVTDDVVILALGGFPSDVREIMEVSLIEVYSWVVRRSVNFNSCKTDMKLFTTKTKIPHFSLSQRSLMAK